VVSLGDDEPQQLSALATHTCLLDTAGRIRCWGSNAFGQLGNNSTVSSEVPVWIEVP
jgi:alpha-tubulin suppressor-like RCC1 family protein